MIMYAYVWYLLLEIIHLVVCLVIRWQSHFSGPFLLNRILCFHLCSFAIPPKMYSFKETSPHFFWHLSRLFLFYFIDFLKLMTLPNLGYPALNWKSTESTYPSVHRSRKTSLIWNLSEAIIAKEMSVSVWLKPVAKWKLQSICPEKLACISISPCMLQPAIEKEFLPALP